MHHYHMEAPRDRPYPHSRLIPTASNPMVGVAADHSWVGRLKPVTWSRHVSLHIVQYHADEQQKVKYFILRIDSLL